MRALKRLQLRRNPQRLLRRRPPRARHQRAALDDALLNGGALGLHFGVGRQHLQIADVIAHPRHQRLGVGRLGINHNIRRLGRHRHGKERQNGPHHQQPQPRRQQQDVSIAQQRMDIVKQPVKQVSLPNHHQRRDHHHRAHRPFQDPPSLRPLRRQLPPLGRFHGRRGSGNRNRKVGHEQSSRMRGCIKAPRPRCTNTKGQGDVQAAIAGRPTLHRPRSINCQGNLHPGPPIQGDDLVGYFSETFEQQPKAS